MLEEASATLFSLLLNELYEQEFEVKKEEVKKKESKDEKFILAKVIVGMKLMAGEVLAVGAFGLLLLFFF